LVDELQLLSGGCAANTAAGLAKLGVEAQLVASVGQDALGDAALADLQAAGVGLDAVVRTREAPTSSSIVLVSSSGERSFFYRKGGNERLTDVDVTDGLFSAAQLVHVGGAMKLLSLDLARLTRRAKSFGCITSLDTDWDVHGRWMQTLENVLPTLDYLLTNEEEAAMLSGRQDPRDAARELLARGPQAVVVKRGDRGAMLAASDGVREFPTYPVTVVDTTCAGDGFTAGFLLGVCRGWTLDGSMRLANAAGALCTTAISHRGVLSLEQAERLVDS
jgi:sugar/nucleoside kinase (ribokinase family)